MTVSGIGGELDERVGELVRLYSGPDISVAELLCDRHPAASLAYRIVNEHGCVEDLSYGELGRESQRFAAALAKLGVQPGDRVATLMGKSRELLVALMGLWRLGAVHVPLFTAFAPAAIDVRLSGSRARVVICDATQQPKLTSVEGASEALRISTGPAAPGVLNFHDLIAVAQPSFPAARLGGDAPIIHIFTSGTTGTPKAVVVPARALASFRAYAEFGLGLRPDDLYWCAADPGWAYGLYFGILGELHDRHTEPAGHG